MSVRDELYVAVAKFGMLGAITMGLFDAQASGGVSSVNGNFPDQEGSLQLTSDDVPEGLVNKYLSPEASDKILNLSGINTGDQDLSELVPKTFTINGKPLSGNISLVKADIGLSDVDNTSDANKPISEATQIELDGKVDKDFYTTSTSTNTDVVRPNSTTLSVVPPSDSEGIFFGTFGQTVWNSPQNLTGGGHICGAMGWGVLNNTGTLAMALGVEGRLDVMQPGTITQAKPLIGLLLNSAGTVTTAKGCASEVNNGSGRTISNAYGFYAEVPANGGTITKYVGYSMPNMQGVVGGIVQKYFFENLDTAAPSVSKSPIIQQDYGYSAPTTGQTLQIPNNNSDWTLIPSGTLASLTVLLPTAPIDGFAMTISTTQTITALTVDAASGVVYNAPTVLEAGDTFEYKFIGGGIDIWIRKR